MRYFILLIACCFCKLSFSQNPYADYTKWRLSAGIGAGYRFGKAAPDATDEYIKGIRLGNEVNADAAYFFSPSTGIGLKYSYFIAGGSMPNVISNVNLHYIGPIVYNNLNLNSERSKLLYGTSIGLLMYRDDGWLNNQKSLIAGNTIGALLELAYDYRLGKRFYAGANLGLSGGVLRKAKVNGVQQDLGDNKEGLTRASLNIGVRYRR